MADASMNGSHTTNAAAAVAEGIHLFRQDAARWTVPEQFSDPELVTPLSAIRLLLRHPSLRAMGWLRLGAAAHRLRVRGVSGWVQRRLLRLYGLEVIVGADIGGGLYIAHPVGCVLAARSIGTDVTVISQVTFGTREDRRWPSIGDRTFFGAGCRVLGGIDVGAGARVGANAVVLEDVGPNRTVVGVPAADISASRRAGQRHAQPERAGDANYARPDDN